METLALNMQRWENPKRLFAAKTIAEKSSKFSLGA